MQCHNCPHRDKPPSRRRAICIDCAATNRGKLYADEIPLDELEGKSTAPRITRTPFDVAADAEDGDGGGIGGMDATTTAMLLDFFRQFLRLTPLEMAAIGMHFRATQSVDRRPFLAEIGAELGISKQRVKDVLCNAFSKCPALAALFPGESFTLRATQRERLEAASEPRYEQPPLMLEFSDNATPTKKENAPANGTQKKP